MERSHGDLEDDVGRGGAADGVGATLKDGTRILTRMPAATPDDRSLLRGEVLGAPRPRPPDGYQLSVGLLNLATATEALSIPAGVTNWTHFEGALMSVIVMESVHSYRQVGTAVMLAPGLAVSAAHVLHDELESGTNVRVLCAGPRSTGLDMWAVKTITNAVSDDIMYLSLEPASPFGDGWCLFRLPITTRQPDVGENLHVVGFRLHPDASDRGDLTFSGNLFAAAGKVTGFYEEKRDSVMIPFPAIEIACGSLGGMSGGAVIDEFGHLIGVTSAGLDTEDGEGPTYAAWIVGALNRRLPLGWPQGIYGGTPIHLLDIDQKLLVVDDRSRVRIEGDELFYRN